MKGEDEHREAAGYQNEARVRTGITDVNLLTTEVTHVANRRDRVAGIASSGEFAGVAVQHRLGILPKWRTGPGGGGVTCTASRWPPLRPKLSNAMGEGGAAMHRSLLFAF